MHVSGIARMIARGWLAGVVVLFLAGCDYWPPALQAQIEQLKREAQQAATERVTLEEQLTTATGVRTELQARVAELAKANDQLAARVTTLELELAAESKKVARLTEEAKKAASSKSPKAGSAAKAKKTPAPAKPRKTLPGSHRRQ